VTPRIKGDGLRQQRHACGFQRQLIDKIARAELMAELLRVANARDLVEFGKREFSELASVCAASVIREFGSWSKAIDWLRSELAQQGKALQKKNRGYFTKSEAFTELERGGERWGIALPKSSGKTLNPQLVIKPTFDTLAAGRMRAWRFSNLGPQKHSLSQSLALPSHRPHPEHSQESKSR
jgi:hypothetical protein